ncbi:MAG: cupin domain-containing protein [Thermodesulfobacteriota bacterium]
MDYGEKKYAQPKAPTATYYQDRLVEVQKAKTAHKRSVVSAEEMEWELCQQGHIKHLVNEKMETASNTLDICMQVIPGGSRSGKHCHMAEEYMFILEGKGYSLHWDVDFELGEAYYWKAQETPSKWEWERGDSVYIPPNTVHQHFNSDPKNPVRFISAESRMFKYMGLDTLEQFENAPEFDRKK